MHIRDLEQHFKNHQLITSQQMRSAFSSYNRRQISEWTDKGWLLRIRQGQYILSLRKEQIDRELLANEIKNSYISLQYALNYYNLIPEIPQQITSITTERTETTQTPVGNFSYHHIKKELFTGYQLRLAKLPDRKVKIAFPTKALFDFIYLGSVSSSTAFAELRLNYEELSNLFIEADFVEWQKKVAKPAINNRLRKFLNFVKNHG